MCCITFIDFHMLNHTCIPGMKKFDHGVCSSPCIVDFGLTLFY
jgi:hypothetical protein